MCQASRVFKATDPIFSKRCLQAAQKAWDWLEKNPSAIEKDFAYTDNDPSQEALWALGEMARTTGDPQLRERFTKQGVDWRLLPVSWMQPQFFGYLSLLCDPNTPAEEKIRIRSALGRLCDNLVKKSEANGYGTATTASEYYWESNEALLHRHITLRL
jgi:endoglucanase